MQSNLDKYIPMKKQLYVLLIALMIGGRGMAEDNVIVYTETFDGYETVIYYTNQDARVYEGELTTWSVINGGVTTTGISGKKAAIQYNAEGRAGEITSQFIPRLDSVKMSLARAAANTVTANIEYSRDGKIWRNLGSKTGSDLSTSYYINMTAALPDPKPSEPDGAYIRVRITATKHDSYDFGSNYRVYIDDIVTYQHPEVADECGNCFPITL